MINIKRYYFILFSLIFSISNIYSNQLKLINKLDTLTYPNAPEINGKSAILISEADGSILFEKNIDEQIPPASLTKLVVFYTAFEIINEKSIDLDTVVPLSPNSWHKNLPSDSSLMFLGPDQKVTLNELFYGLSVASGNDAAVAIAEFLGGTEQNFVKMMNDEVKKIGLTNTVFVDSSGYDENNLTTARDFGAFCYNYIKKYPKNLENYHSLKSFTYPKKTNLAKGNSSNPITQKNRNSLLWKYDGIVDGLKTGFTYESGFNIATTGKINNFRLISVVLGNFTKDNIKGDKLRENDVSSLFDYGFNNFIPITIKIPQKFNEIKSNVWLGDKRVISFQKINEINLTLPKEIGSLYYKIIYKKDIVAPLGQNDIIGYVFIMREDSNLFKIPVYSDTDVIKKSGLNLLFSYIEFFFYKQFVLKNSHIDEDFTLNLS